MEAARNGSGDILAAMNISISHDKPEFLTTMDVAEDAVIIINATGSIMLINQAVTSLFGYTKTELEGANISMLMPQPFSGRHNSYLARYVSTGEPRILDSVRDVLGLHKDHFVFPLSLCVTKLSGSGADGVFLGLVRPMPTSMMMVRVWVAPSGQVSKGHAGDLCMQ